MAKKKQPNKDAPAGQGSTGGESSLRTIVEDLRNKQIDSNDIQISANFILTNISANLFDINQSVMAIRDVMVGDKMSELEKAAEEAKFNEALLAALKKGEKAPEKQKGGDFSWLGLAGTLIAGLVAGGMAFVKEYIASVVNVLKAIGGKLKINAVVTKIFDTISDALKSVKAFVDTGFQKALTAVKTFFAENKIVQAIKGFFTAVGDKVKAFFKFDDLLQPLQTMFKSMKDIFTMISEPIKKALGLGGNGGFFKSIMDSMEFLKPVQTFFKTLGTILGKLALPLQVVMSIWDTVSGALDGWNKTEGGFMDKFFGALKGGLTGLVNGLIGGLLDLLKGGLTWIMNLLGFENAVKTLESFSFQDLIAQAISGFFDFVKGMVNFFVDLVKNPGQLMSGIGSLADTMNEAIKKILRQMLPKPGSGGAAGFAAKFIPDAIYEYAGLDPKTGEEVPKPPAEATAEPAPQETRTPQQIERDSAPIPQENRTAQQLEKVVAENKDAKTEQQTSQAATETAAAQPVVAPASGGQAAPAGGGGGGGGAVVTTKTTAWDPEDSWARGTRGGA
jgi:uncharacterized protein YqgV (UPF0045/DUF77 family)